MLRRLLLPPAALIAASLVPGAASTLGTLTSTHLNGFTGAGTSGSPTVYASDNFTGVSGSNLDGRSLVVGGQKWVVGAGTWTLNANQVEINGVPLGRAVAPAGRADVRLVVTLADAGQGGRTSGVVFRSDATATTFLSAYTQSGSGGRLMLAKRVGTTSTVLASFAGLNFTNPATFVVECNGAQIKVVYNGVLYINHTLAAADQLVFGGLVSHGLLNDNAALVRYDDFRAESI